MFLSSFITLFPRSRQSIDAVVSHGKSNRLHLREYFVMAFLACDSATFFGQGITYSKQY